MRISRMTCLLLVVGVAASGCDMIFPKKVAKEDCKKWIDHAFEVVQSDFDGAMKKCSAEMRKMMKKGMDKAMEKGKDEALEECNAQVGEKYEGKEADCFMKGSTMKEMKACNFKVAEKKGKKKSKGDDDDDDKGDKDDPSKALESVAKMCKGAAGAGDDDDKPAKKKKGDDDDDDKPAKKKKKSDDD